MNSSEQKQYKLTPFTQLKCGLGWDMTDSDDFDLDLVALCLDPSGKLPRGNNDLIYAGNPKHDSGSIVLSNDNLTGEGDGDDERMWVNLNQVPDAIAQITFAVAIDCGSDLKQDFSQVKNGFWRLTDGFSGKILIHQSLSNPEWVGKTALLTATVKRKEDGWLLMPLAKTMAIYRLNDLLWEYSE